MRRLSRFEFTQLLLLTGLVFSLLISVAAPLEAATPASELKNAQRVAEAVDRLIAEELDQTKTRLAPRTSDEVFLRRVTFDLAGTVPSPREVTLFGLDLDSDKREKLIDRLIETDEFANNWTRYWRDVIYSRATDQRSRITQGAFEEWMAEQHKQNSSWDNVATALITATGDVRENGATALIFAHGGQASEIAAETSRIFLGIQLQCANCHDHPTDKWKREQFHQLAAFFPRVRVRRIRDQQKRSFEVVSVNVNRQRRGGDFRRNPQRLVQRFDRNDDKKITKDEVMGTRFARVFERLLQQGDTNQDKALSIAEIKKLPRPKNRRRGSTEYFMPNLNNPASRGTKIDPVFFVDGSEVQPGRSDLERRQALAESITSPENLWFARAYVNRIWAEMLGRGFYMPVDDIGPHRVAVFPKVLEFLCQGFVVNNYDMKWLYRTIANTQTYQRKILAQEASHDTPPFASAIPTRLRADQLYSAIVKVLGVGDFGRAPGRGRGPYGRNRSARGQFSTLFGFDPSTPQEDITGTVPQALFLMNSPTVNNLIRGNGQTRLGRILKNFKDDQDAVNELYLLVLAREPSTWEIKICRKHLNGVKDRKEAFEDLMWGLLNSSEFLSKR